MSLSACVHGGISESSTLAQHEALIGCLALVFECLQQFPTEVVRCWNIDGDAQGSWMLSGNGTSSTGRILGRNQTAYSVEFPSFNKEGITEQTFGRLSADYSYIVSRGMGLVYEVLQWVSYSNVILFVIFPWVFLWLFSGFIIALGRFGRFQYHILCISIDVVVLILGFCFLFLESLILDWFFFPILAVSFLRLIDKDKHRTRKKELFLRKEMNGAATFEDFIERRSRLLAFLEDCSDKQDKRDMDIRMHAINDNDAWSVESFSFDNRSGGNDHDSLGSVGICAGPYGKVTGELTRTKSGALSETDLIRLKDLKRISDVNFDDDGFNVVASTSSKGVAGLCCAKTRRHLLHREESLAEHSNHTKQQLQELLQILEDGPLPLFSVPSESDVGERSFPNFFLEALATLQPLFVRHPGGAQTQIHSEVRSKRYLGKLVVCLDRLVDQHIAQQSHLVNGVGAALGEPRPSPLNRRSKSCASMVSVGSGSIEELGFDESGANEDSQSAAETDTGMPTPNENWTHPSVEWLKARQKSRGCLGFDESGANEDSQSAAETDGTGMQTPSENWTQFFIDWLRARQKSLGCTALCLSGGGSLAMIHMGLCKFLLQRRMLPHVISGVSGGSIVAGFLAIHTNEELENDIFVPEVVKKHSPHRWFPPVWKEFYNFLRHGVLVTRTEFEECCEAYFGEWTFQEAYEHTGRCVSIVISSNFSKNMPACVMLNHVTTPRVTIASAVATSCAAPGIMHARGLFEKTSLHLGSTLASSHCAGNKRRGHQMHMSESKKTVSSGSSVRSRIIPFNTLGRSFWDGSLTCEVPKDFLRSYFGVTQFIVSQVNPHMVPVLQMQNDSGVIQTLQAKVAQDLQKRARILSEFQCLPSFFGRRMAGATKHLAHGLAFSEHHHDGLTIYPITDKLGYSCVKDAVTNPSIEDMRRYILIGSRMAWEQEEELSNRMCLEIALRESIKKLQTQQVQHF